MKKLVIYRHLFTASDCYQSGVRQKAVGVQVHSTGANNPNLRRYVQPDDGRLGQNLYGNSHNRSGGNVCASAYIGRLADGRVAVYQTLPWDMRCWLSGAGSNGSANRLGYIGFEICEDDLGDEVYFSSAVRDAAVCLTAHLCEVIGTAPAKVTGSYDRGETLAVMDHSELSALGLASGHADIGHWLRRYGYGMDDFRGWVEQAMREGVEAEYVDAGMEDAQMNEIQEVVSPNGGYVNLRAQMDIASASLQRLRPGEQVRVTGISGQWSRVETETAGGYVLSEFLRLKEDTAKGAVMIPRETAQMMYEVLSAALGE